MNTIIAGYVGSHKTGIGRYADNIIDRMSKEQCNDSFILLKNSDYDDYSNFGNNVAVRPYIVSKNSSMGNLLWHQLIYPFYCWWYKADVSFIPNVTLLIWKTCPTVVAIHDLIEFRIPGKFSRLRQLYRSIAVPVTARRADVIITVSKSSKKDIIELLKIPANKVIVIPNGIDPVFRTVDEHELIKLRDIYQIPQRYILYVGTLDHPGKNALTLVKAFESLKRGGSSRHKLVLIGKPGKGYEEIERVVNKSEFRQDILIKGYIGDEELIAWYNCAEVFSFLSLYEGFGLPALEAMACGVPVIVSNQSSLPEVVGNAGIMVDPINIEEVTEALKKLTENKELREKLRVAGKKQAEKFSWDKAAQDTYRILESVNIDKSRR